MTAGNILKKEKVVILDWVQTLSFTIGNCVFREGLLYRANGAIPAGTGFTIGASETEWEEMLLSENKEFDMDDGTLTTDSNLRVKGTLISDMHAYGKWYCAASVPLEGSGIAQIIPWTTVIREENVTFDNQARVFGLDGELDEMPYIEIYTSVLFSNGDFTFNSGAWNTLQLGLVHTDDGGVTFSMSEESSPQTIFSEKSSNVVKATAYWEKISHVPGRKYSIWMLVDDANFILRGGTRVVDWVVNEGEENIQTGHHTWVSIKTVG